MNVLASTAVVLALLGLLMGLSVLASRVAGRASVPVALLFLVIGMLWESPVETSKAQLFVSRS